MNPEIKAKGAKFAISIIVSSLVVSLGALPVLASNSENTDTTMREIAFSKPNDNAELLFSGGDEAVGAASVVGASSAGAGPDVASGEQGSGGAVAGEQDSAGDTVGAQGVTGAATAGGGASDNQSVAGGDLNTAKSLNAPTNPIGNDNLEKYTPEVGVYLADGITPVANNPLYIGSEIVVKAKGFDPNANIGGRGVPVPANLPQGSYLVFGSFQNKWQPSSGATSAARKTGLRKWALTSETLGKVPAQYQGAISAEWIKHNLDGTYETKLTLGKLDPLSDANYGIYTYAAGGIINVTQEKYVPLNFTNTEKPVYVPNPKITLNTEKIKQGEKITINLSGYSQEKNLVMGLSNNANLAKAKTDANGTAVIEWQVPQNYKIGKYELEVKDESGYSAKTNLEITAAEVIPPPPVTKEYDKLVWGFKKSWRDYLQNVAKAQIKYDSGASANSEGLYEFILKPESTYNAQNNTGIMKYSGSVNFLSDIHGFNIVMQNIWITFNGTNKATMSAEMSKTDTSGFDTKRVDIAVVDVSGRKGENGVAVQPNEESSADAVSADAVSTDVVSAENLLGENAPVGENKPFSAKMLSLDENTLTKTAPVAAALPILNTLTEAEPVAAHPTANTTVIYNWQNAQVSFIATLAPQTLNANYATQQADSINFSFGRGITTQPPGKITPPVRPVAPVTPIVPVAPAPTDISSTTTSPMQQVCVAKTVNGSNFTWGIKSSFTSYVTGPVSKGSVSLSGVTQSGAEYVFSGGNGEYNTQAGVGLVNYGGSLTFTGHENKLRVNIANASIQFVSNNSAIILVDITASNPKGEQIINNKRVVFASINLGAVGKVNNGNVISWAAAPVTLSEEGAKAFAGFYAAGTALDPISISLPIGGDVNCSDYSNPKVYKAGGKFAYSLAHTGESSTGYDYATVVALMLMLAGFAIYRFHVKRFA